jgi:hypothetical protein
MLLWVLILDSIMFPKSFDNDISQWSTPYVAKVMRFLEDKQRMYWSLVLDELKGDRDIAYNNMECYKLREEGLYLKLMLLHRHRPISEQFNLNYEKQAEATRQEAREYIAWGNNAIEEFEAGIRPVPEAIRHYFAETRVRDQK